MSCNPCGMRRFDGHGSSSYRPTNPEAAKEMKSAMSRMLAERERQDKGLFTGQREGLFGQIDSQPEIRTTELKLPEKTTIIKLYKSEKTEKTETKATEQFYSLSD
uniref:Uncharacterized protein n=1 Tax=viral metagenome TaxID=1070528 RepID=A0A6C0ANV6_9ZZZZ